MTDDCLAVRLFSKRVSRILEVVNPLALQNGHFMQSRTASEKIKH
jgi:hypothetical protein